MSVGNPNRGDASLDLGDDATRDPAEGLQRDAAFVSLLRAGDPSAFGLLFDGWADPVYDRLSHQGFTTADVCDLSTMSFASVHRRLLQQTANDPFRVLIFRSVRQEMTAAADRRVQWRMPVGPYAEDRLERGADARSLAADAAVAALLWDAADVLGERVRDVLDLHRRHGFTAAEIAAVLNEPTADIDDILGKLPIGFGAVVRAQVLWRQGGPTHDVLAEVVAGADPFDTDTVRLIAGHQRECASCREVARLHVDPIDVFAAIPLAAAPLGLNEVVVERLTDLDLSMIGSVSYRDPAAIAAGEPGAIRTPRSAPDDSTSAALAPPPQPHPHRHPSDLTTVVPPLAIPGRLVGATPTRPATVDPVALAAAVRARNLVASQAGSPTDLRIASVGTSPAPDASRSSRTGMGITAPPTQTPIEVDDPSAPPSGRRRRWLLLGIGILALMGVAAAVAATRGSSEPSTQSLTSTAANRPIITTTQDPVPSTATTAPAPTTAESTVAASADPAPTTPTTAAAARPPAVGAPPTPPTTAVPFPTLAPFTFSASAPAVLTASAPLTFSWEVTADKPVTVVISGPNFSSTALSGSAEPVCPVALSGSLCNADPGVYHYDLVVTDALGRTRSKTVQFTVTARL